MTVLLVRYMRSLDILSVMKFCEAVNKTLQQHLLGKRMVMVMKICDKLARYQLVTDSLD